MDQWKTHTLAVAEVSHFHSLFWNAPTHYQFGAWFESLLQYRAQYCIFPILARTRLI